MRRIQLTLHNVGYIKCRRVTCSREKIYVEEFKVQIEQSKQSWLINVSLANWLFEFSLCTIVQSLDLSISVRRRLYSDYVVLWHLLFSWFFRGSSTFDKFSRRRILNNAWREFTVLPGTRYFAYIENVRSDDTRSTAINTMLDNDPDTLTQRWKHFSERDLLVKSRPVSLPCFSRSFLKTNSLKWNRSFCAFYRASFSISIREHWQFQFLLFLIVDYKLCKWFS